MQQSYFDLFALPEAYQVDLKILERKYFDLQRLLHPDRFVGKTGAEKFAAQSRAVEVNQAYDALRNPLKRAEYILSRQGIAVAGDNKTVNDPEVLMEAMAQREALLDAATPAALSSLEQKADGDVADLEKKIAECFAGGNYAGAAQIALKLKYLYKFKEEIDSKKLTMGN